MTRADRIRKRAFDIALSAVGLALLWPVILVAWVAASVDTRASGFFLQTRVGKDGRLFRVLKLRTMRVGSGTTVTVRGDARITPLGARFRRWKLDELPQLWNVLKGDMSFVGPRPDVPGFLDRLEGEERAILTLRPGITGPATLKYRDEEGLLAGVEDPERFNAEVLWPDKVRINLHYLRNWRFRDDLRIIIRTVFGR
ncbi:putative undecaprenyl-phosphate galactose phosphotransferase [Pseudooceanicola batsensis HTCC2597]|uniref:Putative undecaprenyl-phosphate galactose phosphotransferase n=1 Tax=Pseudooceanicola batsensis (strain ATCC BAA-863 / DSM 15984 / KCTC 12145 / HTCC2597) TaxID=252305 RepID=A3TY39_PSEBH|nr:sugar transferase [Pseudooceanicola batsensis]EAQ03073.1 putative undecaprenyl-phosphate galactose phosphotransferase [Pseudooceanicola batsensis HTCC2597]